MAMKMKLKFLAWHLYSYDLDSSDMIERKNDGKFGKCWSAGFVIMLSLVQLPQIPIATQQERIREQESQMAANKRH